ncbi:transcriptional regulator [Leuconostoc gelidum subsp. aenigmaticum]|uniref:transcriptional regulator n=1 Tax=Leuconostoc gelidum TaxID=1244 RepID=UPI001C7CEEA7|nr:transcriptional regulator [Leuconostoc gelidum]MBZ6003705.1 transcriptional regulator [Leuconostoc gelidum subsp. aenigmaticum]MBZ6008779.1 transcriptional regulator [Leuconostoc gelidum subsp. aenigmaticum]MBZ6010172.1 transcriptional regulator [Leuconostoc gelidum subsp. aenigmaticum]
MKFLILDSERTNNFTDPNIQTKIMSLWEKNSLGIKQFLKEDLTIACVYHEYRTNYKDDYTVSLCKEDDINGVFDTSKYQWKVYKVDVNDKLGVINTWQKIWLDEENHKINRVYDFDFEQYKPNGEISIVVAIF